MDKQSKIYVAGDKTLIGAALLRELDRQGYSNVINPENETPDLTDRTQVDDFFSKTVPEYVFFAAGMSGGILANQKYPANLMLDNLLVECHVIDSAYRHGVKKLLYLASSCCYPKQCPQPMQVESLCSGPLEPTNEAYAMAKIAGIKLCQSYCQQYNSHFIVALPANAFGPGDDFSLENSHVIPALIRKIHQAQNLGAPSLKLWGSGSPRREFIYADDLANACIFLMFHYDDPQPINVGCGMDISIKELAEKIKKVMGFQGELLFDSSKLDGMPQKLLDSSHLNALGWQATTSLEKALMETVKWFRQNANGSI
ncbi:MAG: GDP-L-fucose synthase family protein [bacterium]